MASHHHSCQRVMVMPFSCVKHPGPVPSPGLMPGTRPLCDSNGLAGARLCWQRRARMNTDPAASCAGCMLSMAVCTLTLLQLQGRAASSRLLHGSQCGWGRQLAPIELMALWPHWQHAVFRDTAAAARGRGAQRAAEGEGAAPRRARQRRHPAAARRRTARPCPRTCAPSGSWQR